MMLHDITVTTDYDIGEGWTGESPEVDIIGSWHLLRGSNSMHNLQERRRKRSPTMFDNHLTGNVKVPLP